MSKLDYLSLRRDVERLEEALAERLSRIETEANPSQDAITVAAVERMLASKYQGAEDEDIEDDFAGGTAGADGSPWLMPWPSHLAELVLRLAEFGYDKWAALLKELADTNSQKKPFTKADEAEVIKSIREALAGFKKEVGGDGAPPAPECFVTLLQAASMVNKTKSTLEKRAKTSPMPLPDVEGGGGTAAEWKWSTIRPWLEKEFKRQLPEHFPSDRFIRR